MAGANLGQICRLKCTRSTFPALHCSQEGFYPELAGLLTAQLTPTGWPGLGADTAGRLFSGPHTAHEPRLV